MSVTNLWSNARVDQCISVTPTPDLATSLAQECRLVGRALEYVQSPEAAFHSPRMISVDSVGDIVMGSSTSVSLGDVAPRPSTPPPRGAGLSPAPFLVWGGARPLHDHHTPI